jgi:hypothetical protein
VETAFLALLVLAFLVIVGAAATVITRALRAK